VSGNSKVSIEFFFQAEKQLEALLKAPESAADYSIAMAALAMVWQSSYLQVRKDKCNGFLETAASICKNIKAFNSEVFIKYLFCLAMSPHSFMVHPHAPPSRQFPHSTNPMIGKRKLVVHIATSELA